MLLLISMQMRHSACWLMITFSPRPYLLLLVSHLWQKDKTECSPHRKLASLVQQVVWVTQILQRGCYKQQQPQFHLYSHLLFIMYWKYSLETVVALSSILTVSHLCICLASPLFLCMNSLQSGPQPRSFSIPDCTAQSAHSWGLLTLLHLNNGAYG